ncbi:Glucuronoxylan 4-O-methyltransferase 3 [Acorus gramineus]|uniref:Glucuronoxylan 4-O-methyltransferase 3 n=1 Tax=Acorus gramineus TaxID=55184 RepID=A0AAV9BE38_ACOGR|nr:Glucuronoxylan 4-O-methyltransferase 3 [Acorus gramineus]
MHSIKSKAQTTFNIKVLLLSFFLIFLLLFILRSTFSSSSPPPPTTTTQQQSESQLLQTTPPPTTSTTTPTCTKLPPSLAQAITHYTTSNTTPQQTFSEISITTQVLDRKSPCNFLVFGLGHDSLMWSALNHGGRTVFLDEDKTWIDTIKKKFPELESYHVAYDTKVRQADELLELGKQSECTALSDVRESKCRLALKGLPGMVYEVEWDLIMVDAPTGFMEEAPGRMTAIYTAGMMARMRSEGETDVFVHDCDRPVEDKFTKALLCEGYMVKQEGRLRHFTIPSHRSKELPFCPA